MFQTIDADRHVMEPAEIWAQYIDGPFRHRVPEYRHVRFAGQGLAVPYLDDKPVWRPMTPPTVSTLGESALEHREANRRAQTVAGHLADMDSHGISRAFLFPTIAGYLVSVDTLDPELSHALADAYNRWLLDFCAAATGRLFAVGLIARHIPEKMAAQAIALAGRGVRAVVLRPNPVLGRTLSHPSYEPFWTACEQSDLAVCIHEGTHAQLPTAGSDRFESRFGQHACSHPMEQMMAMLSLIEGGVLERHPRLRVAFLEAGCGWLPYWLWRLDEVEYGHLAAEVTGRVVKPPSLYFHGQCWVAFEPTEPLLPEVIERVGAERFLFGTDFPHVDHAVHADVERKALSQKLPPDTLEKVMFRNAEQFFGLSP
jgi:predicted TIM-barrel fold metal-dependent hydrolase